MAGNGGKGKRQHTAKSNRQWGRTAANYHKRRTRHAAQHPNDMQAPRDWFDHPIIASKP